jgi:pimeloyl-ACP methyl ester carboxylesterase
MLVRTVRLIGSPGYPFDEARMRERAERTYDRGVHRSGTVRQLAAIMADRDRTPRLRTVRIPALVVHGAQDPLVHVSGGRATARAIPGADLDVVPGMGHDLPRAVWPRVVTGITRIADRAEVTA